MSAADEHIAKLEAEARRYLKSMFAANKRIAELEAESERLHEEVGSLRKQLVQRDVYEAEQRLPPEHAVLIKHLATVEKCIAEGPVTYHYAEESCCSFCEIDDWYGHARDCNWVELQMDRGVTSVLDDIHAVALREHERRRRHPTTRMTATEGAAQLQTFSDMLKAEFGSRAQEAYANNPFLDMISAAPAHRDLSPEELERARQAIERSREQTTGDVRVYINPNVAPGAVLLKDATQAIENLRLTRTAPQYEVQMQMPDAQSLTPEERYEDSGGVAGSAPSAVAPPDEDDVP